MYFFPPSTSLVSVFLQTIVQNRFAPISHCTSTCVFQSSPPNMENTTPYYDDADGPFVTPCSRYSDNNVGAKLSILYYFMFLISLFGNGLVLIIIYRWVVTESEARIKPTWCCIKKKNFFFFSIILSPWKFKCAKHEHFFNFYCGSLQLLCDLQLNL